MNNPNIHPTAIIDPSAKIGEGTVIGPFTIIGKNTIKNTFEKNPARIFLVTGYTSRMGFFGFVAWNSFR